MGGLGCCQVARIDKNKTILTFKVAVSLTTTARIPSPTSRHGSDQRLVNLDFLNIKMVNLVSFYKNCLDISWTDLISC